MTFTHLASPGRLRFAAALLLGTTFATVAHAETLTVTDVVPQAANGLYTINIPSVEVTDGNLTEAEIRGLFQIGAPADLEKWAKITAKSLVIPEVKMTISIPATAGSTAIDETVVMHGIELHDVVDGVAGSTVMTGADITTGPDVSINYGKFATGRYDIGATLGLFGIGAATGSTEMKELYSGYTFDGGKMRFGDIVQCDIGAGTWGKLLARPIKTSLADLEGAFTRLQDAQTATPATTPASADLKTVIGFYTDIFTAFRADPSQVAGFKCSGTDPMNSKSFSVSSGSIDMGGFEPGIYPTIALNDFAFDAGSDGFLNFKNFIWKNMDLNGPIAALNAAETLDENWFIANWRKLIPAMDGLSVSGVGFDLPNPSDPSARIKGTAGLFDVTLAKYIDGIPSQIALALDDATLPLPPELTAGPAAAEFSARNITEVNTDTHVKLHYDEASQTIVIDELLSNADNLYGIAITGTIGNASPALFGEDENAAMQAGIALTVKDLTINLEDQGAYGMVLAISAQQGGQPLQSTRTAISGMVQGMTLAILGNDANALGAAAEMGKFLSGANSKISITLTAKDGAGLSLADLEKLEQDPTVLSGKVDITAVASGDPVPAVEVAPAAPATEAPASPADAGASLQDQKRDLKAPAAQ